jgi:uncharacterized protein
MNRYTLTMIAGFLVTLALTALAAKDKKERAVGVVSTSKSPHAILHDVPISAVQMGEGFWRTRMEKNHSAGVTTLYRLLEEHGVIDNFRRLSGRKTVNRRGYLFTDSDLYKWMEAVALVLQSDKDSQLKSILDAVVDDVVAAQGADGYLNTYHQEGVGPKRFSNFRDNHELYCLGHLLQAGIAYYRGSGERKLLDAGIRYADYVISLFGVSKRQCFPGHPEIEMAMVELYRTTGERKYLDFVDYLYTKVDLSKLDEKVSTRDLSYAFSGLPFTGRQELRSHAVRAMYACSGATDYYMETGDPAFKTTLDLLWKDMTEYKMYVTGGVGSRYEGEAFGQAYELPNERAYTETCAAIGSIFWNWRMLQATGDARYMDVLERTLYNGFLSGVSLSGSEYYYRNPLTSYGDNGRQPWYDCTCCPPNVERLLASLPGYMYSTSQEGIWVHLYHNSTLNLNLEDGTAMTCQQRTRYPWDGEVTLSIDPTKKRTFTLYLHIPEWCQQAMVLVNEEAEAGSAKSGSYHAITREWKRGDMVTLKMAMPVQAVHANPRLRENLGCVAIQRGPLVYCLEGVDQPDMSIFDVYMPLDPVDPSRGFSARMEPETLGGVVVLKKDVLTYRPALTEQPLYLNSPFSGPTTSALVTMIPYYAWANRGKSTMQVWIPSKTE